MAVQLTHTRTAKLASIITKFIKVAGGSMITKLVGVVTTVMPFLCMKMKKLIAAGSDFEFGAKCNLQDHQPEGALVAKIKTKLTGVLTSLKRPQMFTKTAMEEVERNHKFQRELFFFNFKHEELEQLRDEEARVQQILHNISKSRIGKMGHNASRKDIIKARMVNIWQIPSPHGPIVIEFKDEAINPIKKALEKAVRGIVGLDYATN